MPSPAADVRIAIARTVFALTGLDARQRATVRARYRPFLTTRRAGVTIALEHRRAPRRPRIGRPRVRWRNETFDWVVGGCRAHGANGSVRFTTPRLLGPLNPDVFRGLASFLLFREGDFLLHAAGVVTTAGVWLLCGPSGIGKTTLARLAGRRRTLSDDTVAVCPAETVTAWSTPFWGEGGPAMARANVGERVRGIAFLRQSTAFSHRPLRLAEVVMRAMPEVFLPLEDPTIVGRLLETLAGVAARVPCFELGFAPRAEIWDYLDAVT